MKIKDNLELRYRTKIELGGCACDGHIIAFSITFPVDFYTYEEAEKAGVTERFKGKLIRLDTKILASVFVSLRDSVAGKTLGRIKWDEHWKYSSIITKKPCTEGTALEPEDYEPCQLCFGKIFDALSGGSAMTDVLTLRQISSTAVPVVVPGEEKLLEEGFMESYDGSDAGEVTEVIAVPGLVSNAAKRAG